MIAPDGAVNVIEFNCRFGDPEAQPVMLRLQSDLPQLCMSALTRTLDKAEACWDPRCAVGVVMAAGGYPDSYAKGDPISGLDQPASVTQKVFHAGTTLKDGQVVTNGGRVLCATALGATVSEAQATAYALVKTISWRNAYYRTDIAYRAIARENAATLSE
jgi:phosphoribosylamine--glycine ligase